MEIQTEKPFTSPMELSKLMGISKQTFWRLRKEGEWKEGIHWNYIRPNSPRSGVRYNTDLCFHWMATRSCPEQHERAIQAFQQKLHSHEVSDVSPSTAFHNHKKPAVSSGFSL